MEKKGLAPLNLRVPKTLRARLKTDSKARGMTLNEYCVQLLRRLPPESQVKPLSEDQFLMQTQKKPLGTVTVEADPQSEMKVGDIVKVKGESYELLPAGKFRKLPPPPGRG